MSHTPGPWGHVYDGSSVWSVGRADDPQDARIAAVQKCSHGEDGWHEASDNARLIAAAPEFYEAAVVMLAAHDQHARECNFTACGCEECKMFRPIVAKAEGTRAGKTPLDL